MDDANGDVGGHVVRVVPGPESEVGDVAGVQGEAEHRPRAPHALQGGLVGPVPAPDADGRVVEAVHDRGAGAEVVHLLREGEVARVEDHAPEPRVQAEIPEDDVVFAQGIRLRDALAQGGHAPGVSEVVKEREEDREGLLHAEEAVEGPFPVELQHGAAVGRVACEALVRHDVLAGVVAFGRAVPEKETVSES